MAKTRTQKDERTLRQRVIYSLPPELVAEARRFAGAFYDGNNSGFVAAAIRSHIDRLRKERHTAKLRESYAASVDTGRKIAAVWNDASDEVWQGLDQKKPAGRR